MDDATENELMTRNRVPKLVPVGLKEKIWKASCPKRCERLGGAHNLSTGHLERSDTETSASGTKGQLIYFT